jgi:hypothetical protein
LAPNSNKTVIRVNTELQQLSSPARYCPNSRCHRNARALETFGHYKHLAAEILFLRSKQAAHAGEQLSHTRLKKVHRAQQQLNSAAANHHRCFKGLFKDWRPNLDLVERRELQQIKPGYRPRRKFPRE